MIIGILEGYTIKKCWFIPEVKIPPLITTIKVPPLLGMMIMGCIIRNFFGDLMLAYPAPWTSWMRACCLGMLLTRGGLQVSFKGKGLVVLLLSILPNLCEACVAAGLAYAQVKYPIEICFMLGYALANTAASIAVPNMLAANE